MIAVVEPRRENGEKPVEYAAADPLRFERILISLRQLVHAAEIVVHHAHIHTVFRLAAQNVVYGVPHLAGRNDVVFHKNELFRFFQLRQKSFKIRLADRKIRRLRVRKNRRIGNAVYIVGNALGVRVLGQGRFCRRYAAHGLLILLGHGRHPRLFLRRELIFPEHEIEQHAKHRQSEDRDDPGDLVRGVAVPADEIDNYDGGEHKADAVKEREVLIEPGNGKKDGGKLQRNEYAGKHRAGKNNFEKVLHRTLRETIVFLRLSYRKGTKNSTAEASDLTRQAPTAA